MKVIVQVILNNDLLVALLGIGRRLIGIRFKDRADTFAIFFMVFDVGFDGFGE